MRYYMEMTFEPSLWLQDRAQAGAILQISYLLLTKSYLNKSKSCLELVSI